MDGMEGGRDGKEEGMKGGRYETEEGIGRKGWGWMKGWEGGKS